jgi:raffinose/stachyose/melibiose transport system permease protein
MTTDRGPSRLLLLPAVGFFALFALAPMVIVLALSFFAWDGLGPPVWAGLANWTRFASDAVTHQAIWLSLQVMVASWLFQTPVSLLLGVYLAGRQGHRALLGAVYILPLLLSSAATSACSAPPATSWAYRC